MMMQPYPKVMRIVISIPLASSLFGDIERSHARATSQKKDAKMRGKERKGELSFPSPLAR